MRHFIRGDGGFLREIKTITSDTTYAAKGRNIASGAVPSRILSDLYKEKI